MKKKLIKYFLIILIVSVIKVQGMEFINTDEINPGDTGYGLTVLEENKIVKFNVEVINILKNIMAKQDAILVKIDDKRIKKTGVIAGMSGSPVYLFKDGRKKLAGALSFTWSFSKEPYGGITPIKNMLEVSKYETDNNTSIEFFRNGETNREAKEDEVNRDLQTGGHDFLNSDKFHRSSSEYEGMLDDINSKYSYSNNKKNNPVYNRYKNLNSKFKPIHTPVMVGGIARKVVEHYSSEFEELNMIPSVSGSASGSDSLVIDKDLIKPGGVLCVQLIRGDVNVSAIGTITHVTGRKLFAFGHSFYGTGGSSLPMSSGTIKLVVPSTFLSFKLGEAGDIIGTLKQDKVSAVYGELGDMPELVPLSITVNNLNSGREDIYNLKTAQMTFLTPFLLSMSVDNALYTSGVASYYTVNSKLKFKIDSGDTFEIKNKFSNAGNFFGALVLEPMFEVIYNPFKKVKVKKMEVEFDIYDEVNFAWLREVKLVNSRVKKGGKLNIDLYFENYNKDNYRKNFVINLDKDIKKGHYGIMIYPSSRYKFRKEPYDFSDYTTEIKNRKPNNILEVDIVLPRYSPELKGVRLSKSPQLFKELISKYPNRKLVPDVKRYFFKSDKVIYGSGKLFFEVIE